MGEKKKKTGQLLSTVGENSVAGMRAKAGLSPVIGSWFLLPIILLCYIPQLLHYSFCKGEKKSTILFVSEKLCE